ncbi:MAG TPA: helix-turn-helix domain-containing protein [Gemmatimonas sp.]|nr:helix-turn-helix domain-containing protein [Gemmatimonas sp.]
MGTRWPLHTALTVVGGKWKLIATMRILDGVVRFGDLQRSMPGISRKQLAQCLDELARDGLITRAAASKAGGPVRYAVTPMGAALQESATALYAWGARWLDAHGDEPSTNP